MFPRSMNLFGCSRKGFHRQHDLRSAVLQGSIVRLTSALSIKIDELLKCRETKTNVAKIASWLFDSIDSLIRACQFVALSFKRRDSLRPLLKTDIKSTCNRSNKPATLLFGEDLTKTLNDSKLQRKILARDQFAPKQCFASYHFQKRQHFLTRRGRGSYPPQQSPRQLFQSIFH